MEAAREVKHAKNSLPASVRLRQTFLAQKQWGHIQKDWFVEYSSQALGEEATLRSFTHSSWFKACNLFDSVGTWVYLCEGRAFPHRFHRYRQSCVYLSWLQSESFYLGHIYIFLYVGLQYNIHLISSLLTCTRENTHTMRFHGCYRTAIKMVSMPTEQSESVLQLTIVTKSWFTLLTFTHLTFKHPLDWPWQTNGGHTKKRGAVRKREKCEFWTTDVDKTEGKTLFI